MKWKHIFLICVVVVFTFFNSFFNEFIGDDYFVLIDNTFYSSLSNLPEIFNPEIYSMSGDDFLSYTGKYYHSGSVAYRPVLSITYFIGRSLFGLKPFGHHVMNVFFHLLNCLLIYWIFLKIWKDDFVALIGSLLFAVHPVQSEAVCMIGYRADVLSTFWCLLSFDLFLKYRELGRKRCLILSNIGFFMAIFSKESVAVFPFLLMAYDFFVLKFDWKVIIKKIFKEYFCYFLILIFYVFLYVFVFPNKTLSSELWRGDNIFQHFMIMFWIFALYVRDLFLPFHLTIIPQLSVPSLGGWGLLKFATGLFFVCSFFMLIRFWNRTASKLSFWGVWFFIVLIPVSGIIPIENPMAHRFLYLPLVGLFGVLSYLIVIIYRNFLNQNPSSKLSQILLFTVIGLCSALTIRMNTSWENNFVFANKLIKQHPSNMQGYSTLATYYFKSGDWVSAKKMLIKTLQLGNRDPRYFHMMGVIWWENPVEAEKYFKAAIQLHAEYTSPYLALGRMKVLSNNFEEAIPFLEKSLELQSTYTGLGYLIQSYRFLGRMDDAKSIYLKAEKKLKDQSSQLKSLKEMLEGDLSQSVDIGM